MTWCAGIPPKAFRFARELPTRQHDGQTRSSGM